MKGFILAVVVEYLESEYGGEVTQDLKGIVPDGPLSDVYLSTYDYPENSLDNLISYVANLVGIEKGKLAKIIGVYLFSELMVLNPQWIGQCNNAFELLGTYETINDILKSDIPGYVPPSLECIEIGYDVFEVGYRSTFVPPDVAEGVIHAIFIYYDEHFIVDRIPSEPQVDFNGKFILRRRSY